MPRKPQLREDMGPAYFKSQARRCLGQTVRSGRLTRLPCELCDSDDRVEAHHPFGYSHDMRLAVWWLCKSHHVALHVFVNGTA